MKRRHPRAHSIADRARSHRSRPARLGLGIALAAFLLTGAVVTVQTSAEGPSNAVPRTSSEATLEPAVFEFRKVNREYTDLASEIAPIQQGPVVIYLESPENQLTIYGNRLDLRPLPDGSHDFTFSMEFSGGGKLEAEIDASGMKTQFKDDLVVPRQTRRLSGRARITPGEAGYSVTALELPETFEVEIESRMAGQMVTTCEGLRAIPFFVFDCAALNRSMSKLTVPMPDPGETYLIEYARLTEGERRLLDEYLGRVGR